MSRRNGRAAFRHRGRHLDLRGAPAPGWSSRHCGSATATSTPRRCTATSANIGEGLRRVRGQAATTSSSPPRSGRTTSPPREFERAAKESLVRLRLSDVDLAADPLAEPRIPLAETMGALCRMKEVGFTRHIGISEFHRAAGRKRR